MKTRTFLRLISFAMLIVAIVFVAYALANPELGRTIHIGGSTIGYKQYLFCYKVYVFVMVVLFVASFFVKKMK